jgi:hypothetical protein
MKTFTNDLIVVHKHSPYHWVRGGVVGTQMRQIQAAVHEFFLFGIHEAKMKFPAYRRIFLILFVAINN